MRLAPAAAAIGCALCLASTALGAPPPDPSAPAASSPVAMHAQPIFGTDAAGGFDWNEIVVRLDNGGATTAKGTVEVTSKLSYGEDEQLATRAPFSVPAGRSAIVRLPTHGFPFRPSSLTVNATSDNGARLASQSLSANGSIAPLLVDIDEPSRLAVVLRNVSVATTWNPMTYGGSSTATALTIGVPLFDRATGDPILPEQAAAYAPVTVVLVHSDTLARLETASLDALVNWVLSGGTLAVVPARPEDLRGPTLSALVGGTISTAEPPPAFLTLPGLGPSSAMPPINPFAAPAPGGGADDAEAPSPAWPLPRQLGAPLQIGPSRAVRPRLVGYAGGNLHASHCGASAPYGLGEVQLLAFDPTEVPMIDDPWVQARVVELVAHAWDRRAASVFRMGAMPQLPNQLNDVRRSLDPNENFRPALGIAAILLVLYSIVSGPVTFLRAARSGNPLSPLKWAPIWSAAAFATVVLIGLAGKGWRGRARHLSYIESGAGVSRGSIRRFRGFFTSEARSISVATTDRGCVLDAAGEEATKQHRVLHLDRNGATLENLTSLPWQTVVVVEDGSVELRGGVAILPTPDGSADVVNRTGKALIDVIVYMPGGTPTYFAELKDGARVHAATGKSLTGFFARRAVTAGSLPVHPLDASDLGAALDSHAASRLHDAWQPLEAAAGNEIDWWPDDAAVVMAEMVGGEGRTSDSGLSLENDRALLRVVGAGGTP
jgi:hypothetical protein